MNKCPFLRSVLLLIVCILLSSCNTRDSAIPSEVPLPINKETLEPAIQSLLRQTTKAIQDNPYDENAWALHATCLFVNGYFELASKSFDVSLQLDPDLFQIRYLHSICLWRLNQQEVAIRELQRVLQDDPQYDAGWRQLALFELERGNSVLAETAALRAFELNPSRLGTMYVLASAMIDQSRYEDAIGMLTPSLQSEQTPPWLFGLAEKCFALKGNIEEAKRMRALAGPPMPFWPDPWLGSVSKYIVSKSFLVENALFALKHQGPVKAFPILTRAFNVDPNNNAIRIGLAYALKTKGKLQQALRIIEETEGDLSANYWNQYANISIALAESGEGDRWWAKAKECLKKSVELNPDDGQVFGALAQLSMQEGDQQSAATYWLHSGRAYLQSRDWQKSEISFALALNKDNSNLEAVYGLVEAQIGNGNFDAARTTLGEILKNNPADPTALDLQSQMNTTQE